MVKLLTSLKKKKNKAFLLGFRKQVWVSLCNQISSKHADLKKKKCVEFNYRTVRGT